MPTHQTTTFIVDDLALSFTSCDGGVHLKADNEESIDTHLSTAELVELRQLLSTLIKTAQKAEQAKAYHEGVAEPE